MAGTPDGILCHTMSSESWHMAYINGAEVGESGIVAAIAGSFGVPVVFVSGDAATVREVRGLLGEGVGAATVKRSLGRFAARCLAPADATALIERTAEESLRRRDQWPSPYRPASPVEFRVELHTPDKTADYRNKTGVEITAPRTVVSRADNFWQAWDHFWKG